MTIYLNDDREIYGHGKVGHIKMVMNVKGHVKFGHEKVVHDKIGRIHKRACQIG